MEISLVDERDSSWEEHQPRYRVYLHQRDWYGRPVYTTTYDITSADTLQAIDWAQQAAGGYHLWALALITEPDTQPTGQGLVWLVGTNALTSGPPPPALTRMHQRVTQPVHVGDADQSPITPPTRTDKPSRSTAGPRTSRRLLTHVLALVTVALLAYAAAAELARWLLAETNRQLQRWLQVIVEGGPLYPQDPFDIRLVRLAPVLPVALLVWGLALVIGTLTYLAAARYHRRAR